MSDKDQQIAVMEMMIKHEKILHELYRRFSSLYPEMKDFWFVLAIEEEAHADWLSFLQKMLKRDEISLVDRGELKKDLEASLKLLEKESSRAMDEDIPLMDALSLAKSVEQSMIEAKFYEFFSNDSREISETFERLANQTREHLDRIVAVHNLQLKPLESH